MPLKWRDVNIHERFIIWVETKLTRNQFLLLSAVLVGLSAGIAAIILKTAVHYVRLLIVMLSQFDWQNAAYLGGPLLGITFTVLYAKYGLKQDFERGVGPILYAIKKKYSLVSTHKMFSHLISSSITVGLGGSAGLESPIVVTGSAIGSNYSRVYRMIHRERTLMLACGAAAGIAAVFNAPVAGVIFALEAIMTGASLATFTPLIIASVTGALVSMIVLKEEILFGYKEALVFDYHNVPYYVMFAVLTGLVSVYYSRTAWSIDQWVKQKTESTWWRVLRGGIIVAALIFLFPTLFGEGYESITDLMYGRAENLYAGSVFSQWLTHPALVWLFIALAGFAKVFATTFTLSSGGNGGNFAPSLFTGSYMGFLFSRGLNLTGLTLMDETNFVIVGMAGLLSGIMFTPLTAIFLIAELTGGYDLMIPIMIVSAISFAIARSFEKYPLDKKAVMLKIENE